MTKQVNQLKKIILDQHHTINEVSIELTHSCNMSCDFCFNEYSSSFTKKFINFSSLAKILVSVRKQGCKNIRLTGGEPMLHPKFYKILILSQKLGFYIKLNTNGVLINKKNILILEKYVDSILLSFHFPLEKNKFLLEKKIKALYLIRKSKIPNKVLSTRINSYVIENISDITFFLDKFEFNTSLLWFPLKSSIEDDIIISKKEYSILIEKLLYLKKVRKTNYFLGFTPAFCFNGAPHKVKKVTDDPMYVIGLDKMIVTPELDTSIIYYFSPDNTEYPRGSIDFKEILGSKFVQKYSSYDWLSATCKSCDYLGNCFGGNRMNAYLESGNFFGKDPWME